MEVIGLVLAFVVIVVMIMKRINLGIAMFTGSLVIGLTSPNIGLSRTFNVLGAGIFNQMTLELLLVVLSIGIIANVMDKTGLVDQMISAFSVLFRRFEPVLILIPSVMGALTIPGGAMMSAPMINSIARDLNLSSCKKMSINLLYRHILYFVFPFASGMILTSKLTGYNVFDLVIHFAPISIAMGVVGYFTLFHDMDNPSLKKSPIAMKVRAFGELIMIFLPMLLGIFLPIFMPIPFWGALLLGVFILLIYQRKKVTLKLIFQSVQWKLSLGLLGIMVFREFVNQLHGLEELAQTFLQAGLPVWILAVVLPAMVGLLTGTTSGAIGITFPLLLPLLGGGDPQLKYVVLMFGSAFFSYYISPLHFCLILTGEYFGVTLKEIYRELFWPTLAGIGTMIVLFFLY
ncbi:MAG: DUF401 family protein [Halanaerobiales bacterium]|nr:DUF401 family protein [Halanaerobiales bacterium]